MSDRSGQRPERPELAILAEIGDELHRRNRRREQIRRRCRTAVGAAAVGVATAAVVINSSWPLSGDVSSTATRERALLAGSTAEARWRLVADRAQGRDCLKIVLQSATRSRCSEPSTPRGARISASQVTTGAYSFVYGITNDDVQRVAVRLDDGRCSTARTHPAKLDSDTATSRLRVYVAAFRRPIAPRLPAKPAHRGHNPDTIIRVPKGVLRFPGGHANAGTCATAQ